MRRRGRLSIRWRDRVEWCVYMRTWCASIGRGDAVERLKTAKSMPPHKECGVLSIDRQKKKKSSSS